MQLLMWPPYALLLLLAGAGAEPSSSSDGNSTTTATEIQDLPNPMKSVQIQEGSLKKDREIRDAWKAPGKHLPLIEICPTGFLQFGEKCYQYGSGGKDWGQAVEHCESLGGYLAEPKSAHEFNIIKTLVKRNGARKDVWIGGKLVADRWKWHYSKEFITYQPFTSENPDGSGQCLSMWRERNYLLDDKNCHSSSPVSVCEKVPKPENICYVGKPQNYRGTVSKTWEGFTCQRWDSYDPHAHVDNFNTPEEFIDGKPGILPENYCRTPFGDDNPPWCYTTDPAKRWQLCDIRVCGIVERCWNGWWDQGEVHLTCPQTTEIMVTYGTFGTIPGMCPWEVHQRFVCSGNKDVVAFLSNRCNGRNQCKFNPGLRLFGDPCEHPLQKTHFRMIYKCVAKALYMSDVFGTGRKEWTLVFRGTRGVGQSTREVYMNYQSDAVEDGCLQFRPSAPCHSHYRNNNELDNWSNVGEVAFVLYKNGRRVAHILFDGQGSDSLSWYNQSRIITSTFKDLKNDGNIQYFKFQYGDISFLIHGDCCPCTSVKGWVAVVDSPGSVCLWKKTGGDYPRIMYMAGGDEVQADAFGVFVKRKTTQYASGADKPKSPCLLMLSGLLLCLIIGHM